jgi:DNA invertase Pin-like site-specific DNA recombinase
MTDRFGRPLGEPIPIIEQLKACGVALHSLEEKIDTLSVTGELVFHVFGAIAHSKRRLTAQWTKNGIAAVRRAS